MNKLKLLVLLPATMLLAGCTFMKMLEHGTMQEPTLAFQDYEIADINLDRVLLRLKFNAINPNAHKIDTFFADYEFFIGEKSVVSGKDLRVTLIPEGESEVVVPVELAYDKLFETAGTLASLISEGKKEVESRIHIHIHGEFLIYEFMGKRHTREYSYRVNVNTGIPLPEVTVDKVAGAVKGGINNLLGFEVFNTNASELALEALRNTESNTVLYYDFNYFGFDSAYDTTRMKQMLPDIEDYDGVIYGHPEVLIGVE